MTAGGVARWTFALLMALAPVAHAQHPIPDHRLLTRNDLYLLGTFVGSTVAMFPLDRQVIASVRDSARVHSPRLERMARAFGFLGSPGAFIAAGSLYAAGKAFDAPRLERAAVRGGQGILTGLIVAGVLKGTLGRSRPFVTADTNPRDFELFRGFTADRFQAFPSGHTTTAFAFAAAVTADIHGTHREAAWAIGPLLYGTAAATGISRMYEDKHWASDIVMGAAIGTFAGMKVVRFGRTTSGRRLDRRLLGNDALRVGYTLRW